MSSMIDSPRLVVYIYSAIYIITEAYILHKVIIIAYKKHTANIMLYVP